MFRMDEDRARFVDAMTKLLAVVSVVVGGDWTAYTYFNAREHESRIALMEARKPFEANRLDLYLEVSASAAKLASYPPGENADKEFDHFRQLAVGPLALVQDSEVGKAVVAFRDCGFNRNKQDQPCDLYSASQKLSEA